MTNDKVTTTTKKKKSDTCTHELHAHEWSPALQRLTFPSCCPGLLRKMLRSCPSFRSAQARALLYSFLLLIDDLLHFGFSLFLFRFRTPDRRTLVRCDFILRHQPHRDFEPAVFPQHGFSLVDLLKWVCIILQ